MDRCWIMARKFSPITDRVSQEALCYNVIIHIHGVDDFAVAAESRLSFAPSSDDSGLGGSRKRTRRVRPSPSRFLYDLRSDRRHYPPPPSGREDGGPQGRSRSST